MAWHIPYLITYLGVGVFVVAVAARIRMFARTPMHLRWELYPVPHEAKRAAHGGSYLEESEWWSKPRDVSRVAEVRAMATEIVFLEALHRNNRKMWWRSFPFHFGLYVSFAAAVLMVLGSLVAHGAPAAMAAVATPWGVLTAACGALGSGLVVVGALGLLHRRLTDPDLADFTTGRDIFNLVFFVVAFGLAFVTFAVFDPTFALTARFMDHVLFLDWAPVAEGAAGIMVAVTASVLAVLVGYIPLTHMAHFVAKYFAYHSIRWNDAPNQRGGAQEAAIVANLGQKVTWAAPHIQSNGQKTWAELATMDFQQYGEKK